MSGHGWLTARPLSIASVAPRMADCRICSGELELRVRGMVRSVLFVGPHIPPPGTSMNEDLAAATSAKVTTLSIPPIIVQ